MPSRNIYTNMMLSQTLTDEKAKIWEHRVKHCLVYKEYRRRYQQSVRFLLTKDSGKCVLLKNKRAREYYMLPRWSREDGDNEPIEPEASATYYKWQKHNDCTWSSDDEEGTLMGYDSDNKVVFCERKKTGQLVASNQIVCPYQKDILTYDGKASAVDEDGRILAWFDDVKKKYYDEDEDSDDPYKTKSMARDIERKRRRHLLTTRLNRNVKGEFKYHVRQHQRFWKLTTAILNEAAEKATKKKRLAEAENVLPNMVRQLDFAAAANFNDSLVDDRKPAGKKRRKGNDFLNRNNFLLTYLLTVAKTIVTKKRTSLSIPRMHNPYTNVQRRIPLTPRSSFVPKAVVDFQNETKRQYAEFMRCSGPPDPCEYENERDEEDVNSIPSSINLLADDSVDLAKRPTVKPIAEATAGQRDSGDESVSAATLMSDDRYICNYCGKNPCDWFKHGPAVREYHQLQLDQYGPEELMPPHNVQRHRLYRQMALHLGFVRREKHALCVLEGIRKIIPSPNEDYMGHKNV
jgi:hypothetical protein